MLYALIEIRTNHISANGQIGTDCIGISFDDNNKLTSNLYIKSIKFYHLMLPINLTDLLLTILLTVFNVAYLSDLLLTILLTVFNVAYLTHLLIAILLTVFNVAYLMDLLLTILLTVFNVANLTDLLIVLFCLLFLMLPIW